MAVREKELAALPPGGEPPRRPVGASGSPHRAVPPRCSSRPRAGYRLLHRHDRLHRLQGVRGRVQAVEPAPARTASHWMRQQLRQHRRAVGHDLAAREVHRAVPGRRRARAGRAGPRPARSRPLADDERRLQALRHGALPGGLPDRRDHPHRVRHRLHPARHLQRLRATASPPARSASSPGATIDGHAQKCTLCYDRQKDGLVPACAKACPTAVDPVRSDRGAARACPRTGDEPRTSWASPARTCTATRRARPTPSCTRSTCWSIAPRYTDFRTSPSTHGCG